MQILSAALIELVSQLDDMGADITLLSLARSLEHSRLTTTDVAPFVREDPWHYQRAVVVRREHYELLVITWLPGQGSVPHDHAGAISAMLVLQGEATEGNWRIAPDGYVDLDDETVLRAGELTAWQDAGVHTVHNSSSRGELLVTVNVYSPLLRDFRRFVPRPGAIAPRTPLVGEVPRVVVVGGGFSGSITAAQLLRQAAQAATPIQVTLVERRGTVGEGLAYGTPETVHLLNVPAGRMSAWADQPDDFLRWVQRRHGPVDAGDFLPRRWYGEYVRETLLAEANQQGTQGRLEVVFDEVRRLARRSEGGWLVNLARGASLSASAVVLAIGHRPPPDPIGRSWSGSRERFIADPWRPFAMNPVNPHDSVVVLGSGLTAVDCVLSLNQQARSAPITLISRRGLLPQSHATATVPAVDLRELVAHVLAGNEADRVRLLFRRIRGLAAELAQRGQDWRGVVDGLRPFTSELWSEFSLNERREFLGRFRHFWEVHRHRMAPAVAARFHTLGQQGLVRVLAGQVAAVQADHAEARLFVRERGIERLSEIRTAWVVNCTGPAACNSAESNPAVGSLLVRGWVKPDDLSLGLETAANGGVVDIHGKSSHDMFVVGTLRKPNSWESTAVPELRTQAAQVAGQILAALQHSG